MTRRLPLVAAVAALAAGLPTAAQAVAPATNVLVSRPSTFGPLATPTTNDSRVSSSEEGSRRVVSDSEGHRYVAFVSAADGLSAQDDDRVDNVYVRDRLGGVTILVSRADGPAGAGANGTSSEPSISSNGRYVAFQSMASNLAPGTTGLVAHIYVRDIVNGTTRLVDRADGTDGAIANDSSFDPSITVEGGNPVVAFASAATNLDGATNDRVQVYVRDGSTGETRMVSRPNGSSNTAGNGSSRYPSISTNGDYVAFQSDSTNLGVDADALDDVFVRTRATTETRIVSVSANGDSREPSISGDGNEIAFSSSGTDLGPVDNNSRRDIYVRSFSPNATVIASRATGTAGALGNEEAQQPSITDDGNAVVFGSPSTNLTSGDTNGAPDVFMRSAVFGASPSTGLISRPSTTVQADGGSITGSISRIATGNNNHVVAFTTTAGNMGADDEDDFLQVYTRTTGIVLPPNPAGYVSRPTNADLDADGKVDPFRSGVNASFLRPQTRSTENAAAMSGDGRFTVFLSAEDDLSSADDDRFVNVYRRDNLTGETTLASRADGPAGAAANGTSASSAGGLSLLAVPSGAPAISADGNRIAFASSASNLVPGDANDVPDVFVRDIAAGTTVLASRRPDGSPIPQLSGVPAISGDGRHVAFVTQEAMDGDAGSFLDVYLRDLSAGTTKLVSRKGLNGPPGNDDSTSPKVDADGSHVAFATSATDLSAAADTNNGPDIWVRNVGAGTVTLASPAATGLATANDDSIAPAISADGNRIAFASSATNLGGGLDPNGGVRDIFVRDVAAATTLLVSRTNGANGISGNGGSDRPAIDASGTRIVFETLATDLIPGDTNGNVDVLLRDTTAATTELVSRGQGAAGAQAQTRSGTPSISGDGDCVAFETFADSFVAMPPGTDHARVVARSLRGDCPFGPLPEPPPGPPAGPPAGPGADTTAPEVSGVSLAPRRFLAGKRVRARTRKRPATGGRLRFDLSEAAGVELRIQRLRPGRRLRKRCVAPRRAPEGRRCTRRKRRGTLTATGSAGANTVDITGRVGKRKLKPGRYRLAIVATDAAGNASAPARVKFRVLRPPGSGSTAS